MLGGAMGRRALTEPTGILPGGHVRKNQWTGSSGPFPGVSVIAWVFHQESRS